MKIIYQFLSVIFILFATGCSNPGNMGPRFSLEAIDLNNQAVELVMSSSDTLKYQRAIELLEKSVRVDSTYWIGYENKLGYEMELHRYPDAIKTLEKLGALLPGRADYTCMAGVISEEMGDTIRAAKYFDQALKGFDTACDTMSKSNDAYMAMKIGKAVCLIYVRREEEGQQELRRLYDEADETYKLLMNKLMGKSREDLIANVMGRPRAI